MTPGDIAALVTAITSLVTAVGAVLAQLGHIHWHMGVSKPVQAAPPAVPPTPDKQ